MVTPLVERITTAATSKPSRGRIPLHVVPSEVIAALVVSLPPASARRRAAMLAFAVEERVGVAIETVAVTEAWLDDPDAPAGARLALVGSRAMLAAAFAAAPGSRVLPDFLAIRRPQAPPGGAAWAVWREGARTVVRRSDGTGFAVATDALPTLWARAGRPLLLSLGAALPAALPATDLSAAPPPPDPRDLASGFGDEARAGGRAAWRPLVGAASILVGALALHLALLAVDVAALGRVAAVEREAAEAILAPVLPGVALSADVAPILDRLTPRPPEARRSDFLRLLAEASVALDGSGRGSTFRRLSWSAEEGALVILLQGSNLDDLQTAEAALREAGLAVASGASSAGEGGAEVEMRVSRRGG